MDNLLLALIRADSNPTQVCYSFWVLSAMSILNKLVWIDTEKLTKFILSAQVRHRLRLPDDRLMDNSGSRRRRNR